MSQADSIFVPALRFHWLTWIYDPLVSLTTREKVFRKAVVDEIQGYGPESILDLACGTASLTCLLKQRLPETGIFGIDADPQILDRARKKADSLGAAIEFSQGMSFNMPYPDNSFDLVVASLFFHHLTSENKVRTLNEIARVLNRGGRLVVCDWGKPANVLLKVSFSLVRMLDGFEVTRDNYLGHLPKIIEDCGFENVIKKSSITAPLGSLDLITADLE